MSCSEAGNDVSFDAAVEGGDSVADVEAGVVAVVLPAGGCIVPVVVAAAAKVVAGESCVGALFTVVFPPSTSPAVVDGFVSIVAPVVAVTF